MTNNAKISRIRQTFEYIAKWGMIYFDDVTMATEKNNNLCWTQAGSIYNII